MLPSIAEQANLSLTWSETPEDTFSQDEAHIQEWKLCGKTLLPFVFTQALQIQSALKESKHLLCFDKAY